MSLGGKLLPFDCRDIEAKKPSSWQGRNGKSYRQRFKSTRQTAPRLRDDESTTYVGAIETADDFGKRISRERTTAALLRCPLFAVHSAAAVPAQYPTLKLDDHGTPERRTAQRGKASDIQGQQTEALCERPYLGSRLAARPPKPLDYSGCQPPSSTMRQLRVGNPRETHRTQKRGSLPAEARRPSGGLPAEARGEGGNPRDRKNIHEALERQRSLWHPLS